MARKLGISQGLLPDFRILFQIYVSIFVNIYWFYIFTEFVIMLGPTSAGGDAIGWDIALQTGRSRVRFPMVPLEFFIYVILPAALWPCGWLNLEQKWVSGIFPGVKGSWCVGLTTLPNSWVDCLEIWKPQTPRNLRFCPGLQWDCFTLSLGPVNSKELF